MEQSIASQSVDDSFEVDFVDGSKLELFHLVSFAQPSSLVSNDWFVEQRVDFSDDDDSSLSLSLKRVKFSRIIPRAKLRCSFVHAAEPELSSSTSRATNK